MNSSMRIKAPRGSEVMQNKDLTDDLIDDNSTRHVDGEEMGTELEISNDSIVNIDNVSETLTSHEDNKTYDDTQSNQENSDDGEVSQINETESQQSNESETELLHTQVPKTNTGSFESITNDDLENKTLDHELSEEIDEGTSNEVVLRRVLTRNDSTLLRDRKLSLNQTLLTRREGLSQSEFDLHTMGKSPLERKSSFFRKKMDNFLKNTTEIFRRHSSHYKAPRVHSRGSVSMSMQSLHEGSSIDGTLSDRQDVTTPDSVSKSTSSLCLTGSNLSVVDQGCSQLREMASSQPALCGSQTIIGPREHVNSLTAEYPQESLLNSRAISMSSGLVSTLGRRRNSRSKRVTWLANEGLNTYLLQREIDEKKSNMQGTTSYQDLSNMKESDLQLNKTDTKGRRLSYQRAVSGEDPVRPYNTWTSNLLRKKAASESQHLELIEFLENYTLGGFEHITGYTEAKISDEATNYLQWAEVPDAVEIFFEWKLRGATGPPPPTFVGGLETKDFFHKPFRKPLTQYQEDRQAAIRELFITEAYHIRHLRAVVKVFVGTLHNLQAYGFLLEVKPDILYINLPQLLNASLQFWEATLVPMLKDGIENNVPEFLLPYERYVSEQMKALDYLKILENDLTFMFYLNWCQKQESCKRLLLTDIIVTPMQRLTKYSLILKRIISLTDFEPEKSTLITMESYTSSYTLDVNRSMRFREELGVIDNLSTIIEPYDIDLKDEELNKAFRLSSQLNLRRPMTNAPLYFRTLIHQGDFKFKDHVKELEVHVIILTDLLLICKKHIKHKYQWKLIRPKMSLNKLLKYHRYNKSGTALHTLLFVCLDDVGSSSYGFSLTQLKDSSQQNSLKVFELKYREARLSYHLGTRFADFPSRDISELETKASTEHGSKMSLMAKQQSEELAIERGARERVAAMMVRHMDSTESQDSLASDSFDVADVSHASAARQAFLKVAHSTGSSRNSRLSSFQKSTSASHDEAQPGPSTSRDQAAYLRSSSAVEQHLEPITSRSLRRSGRSAEPRPSSSVTDYKRSGSSMDRHKLRRSTKDSEEAKLSLLRVKTYR